MIRSSQLAVIAAAAVTAGCWGSGQTSLKPSDSGFYRGTMTGYGKPGLPPGSIPMVADVQSVTRVQGWAMSDLFSAALFARDDGTGFITTVNGNVSGTFLTTSDGNLVSFEFRAGGELWATGSLERSALPSLGDEVSIPSAGNYSGEYVVVAKGVARGYGTAAAVIQSDRRIRIEIEGLGPFINSGFLTGTFQDEGALTQAVVGTPLGLIPQSPPPQYSFDGSELVLRYDRLPLGPASCWVSLSKK